MGNGTFVGDFDTGSGILAPGSSAGTMTISGNYILGGTGTLEIEIGGFTSGLFDVLTVTGNASLTGGNILFSFLDGYDIAVDPQQLKSLQFLQVDGSISSFASNIVFDFPSSVYFDYHVSQQDDGLFFEAVSTIPEPTTIVLIGCGLLGLLGVVIRQRRKK